jgi:hypothetical protein
MRREIRAEADGIRCLRASSFCCGLWPHFHTFLPTRNRPIVHLLLPSLQDFVVPRSSRRQETMPHRVNAFALAGLATSLAVAIAFGAQGPASAAGECLEKPGSQGDQAGHWYYRTDRVNDRKCWFFEPAKATPPPPPNGGSDESWLSQFAAGVQQTFSFGTPDPAAAPIATSIPASNPAKTSVTAPKPRSRAASPPETHHATGSGLQLSPEDRDALFQEFLRRYELEKSIHPDQRP